MLKTSILLFIVSFAVFADQGIGEKTYEDAVTSGSDDFSLDLDNALDQAVENFDINKELNRKVSAKDSPRIDEGQKLDDADKVLAIADIPRETDEEIRERIDAKNRKKETRNYMNDDSHLYDN